MLATKKTPSELISEMVHKEIQAVGWFIITWINEYYNQNFGTY
jgi:hypothetical protein